MNNIKVTVLMPVYNAEKYLAEAIESILGQTFRDFEFLIINDGSTDGSLEIIKSYTDSRIRLINNEENLKLIATLNKGIELAKGKYIARMDADDISLPQRLEKQYAYMEAHPEVGLLGSYIRTVGLENNYDVHFKTTHDEIKFKLFFDTHFPHPAALIRKSVLTDNNLVFEKEYIHAEDYALWNKMAEVTKLSILPEILVYKRTHPEQISKKFTPVQLEISSKIRNKLFKKLGINANNNEVRLFDDFVENKLPQTNEDITSLIGFFDKLIIANKQKALYKEELFNKFFAKKYWEICSVATHAGYAVYNQYQNSEAKKINKTSVFLIFKFLCKALVKYKYSRNINN